MAEQQPPYEAEHDAPTGKASVLRRVDAVLLIFGVIAVATALYVGLDVSWHLQWIVTIGAIGIGLGILVVSIKPRRQR